MGQIFDRAELATLLKEDLSKLNFDGINTFNCTNNNINNNMNGNIDYNINNNDNDNNTDCNNNGNKRENVKKDSDINDYKAHGGNISMMINHMKGGMDDMTRFNNVKILSLKEKCVEDTCNVSTTNTKNGNNINFNINVNKGNDFDMDPLDWSRIYNQY